MERGVDVPREKPLAVTTERIDEVVASAEESEGLSRRCLQRSNPVVQRLHEAASAGRFGGLSTVNAYVPWWRDDEYCAPVRGRDTQAHDGGGALMNQSIHAVDAVQWLAGSTMDPSPDENPVEGVFAYAATRARDPDRIEGEDTALALTRYRDGTLGRILGATSRASLDPVGTGEFPLDGVERGGQSRSSKRSMSRPRAGAGRGSG